MQLCQILTDFNNFLQRQNRKKYTKQNVHLLIYYLKKVLRMTYWRMFDKVKVGRLSWCRTDHGSNTRACSADESDLLRGQQASEM